MNKRQKNLIQFPLRRRAFIRYHSISFSLDAHKYSQFLVLFLNLPHSYDIPCMCVHVLGDESNRIKMGKWKKCTWSLVCTCSQLVKHRTARLSFASTHFHLMLLMADEPPRANSRFHSYVLNFFFFFVFRFGPCSAPLI